jgi:hypothetical protein
VFASEEEALAAATEAYERYLEVGSQVASEGGANPERMSAVTVDDAYEEELRLFNSMASANQQGIGTQSADTFTLQSSNLEEGEMTLYLCLDTSESQVVIDGEPVASAQDVPTRFPLSVDFRTVESDGRLAVSRSTSWSGTNFC